MYIYVYFQVSKQCQNTLNLKISIIKPPPIQIIFEDTDKFDMDAATQNVTMETNTDGKSMDQPESKDEMDATPEPAVQEPT